MGWTKHGPFTNGSVTPPLDATLFNDIETAFGAYFAPAPTGVAATDNANVNPLVQASQVTGYPVRLQPGKYVANLTSTDTFEQPIILGAGKHLTTIQAATATSPAVRFQGNSGMISGGRLDDVTLSPAAGGGGVALEFSGCGGVQAGRGVRITGNGTAGEYFAEGVRWHNESGSDFTEFDTFEGTIDSTLQPFRYKVANGVESFHGSGPVGNCVVGLLSTSSAPVVQVDAGAFPYNAPLNLSVFMTANSQALVNNGNAVAGRSPHFYGQVRIEVQGATTISLGTGNNFTWLQGGISALAGTTVTLGNLYRIRKVHWNGTAVIPEIEANQWNIWLGNSPTQTTNFPLLANGQYLIALTITATNYLQSFTLLATSDATGGTGTVTTIAHPKNVDTAGYGQPTFAWSTNGLYITNAAYPNGNVVRAFVSAQPLGGYTGTDQLSQF